MVSKYIVTQDILKQCLYYNESAGTFHRIKTCRGNPIPPKARPAGKLDYKGYVIIRLCGVHVRAHHLAWLWKYGKFPEMQIDHINRVRSDNRIENLREASPMENSQNRMSPRAGSSSRFIGVGYKPLAKKWQSRIMHAGKATYLGMYETEEQAASAYLEAKRRLHTSAPI